MSETNSDADQRALDLEAFLPYRLNRIADLVSRRFAAIYRERHGMTRPEWRALATLGQFETATASRIGAHSSMHKTKVSRAVAALEARGWVRRTTDGADRRVAQLALTASGRRIYRELAPLAGEFEARLLSGLGEREAGALLDGLAALERRLLD